MKLMLDTSILARLCQPAFADVQTWFRSLLERGEGAPELIVSVIADYELRRHLLAIGADESLKHLDELVRSLRCVPLNAEASRRAAELRDTLNKGGVTGALDPGLLMAAQALIEGAVLVTSDRTLQRIPGIVARDWNEIDPNA